jgi:hypothetical protein
MIVRHAKALGSPMGAWLSSRRKHPTTCLSAGSDPDPKETEMPFVMIALLLLQAPAQAQLDSARALSMFPLQEGNRWEYAVHVHPYHGLPYDDGFTLVEVQGDTLMPNGMRYSRMSGIDLVGWGGLSPSVHSFARVDSMALAVKVYSEWLFDCDSAGTSEALLLDLGVRGNGSYETCLDGYQQDVDYWADTDPDGPFVDPDSAMYHIMCCYKDFRLSPGFGITDHSSGYLGFTTYDIIYARIDGVEYWATGVDDQKRMIPDGYALELDSYPNPFNPSTILTYTLARGQQVELEIFDLLGRRVRTLVSGVQEAGGHTVTFHGDGLASGVYLARIAAGGQCETRKILLVK